MRTIRIVTDFPQPDAFRDYVPIIKKGRAVKNKFFGLYNLPATSEREELALAQQMKMVVEQNKAVGFYHGASRPAGIAFSLDRACLQASTAPLMFHEFIDFCAEIEVPLWGICGTAPIVAVELRDRASLAAASQSDPSDTLVQGVVPALGAVRERIHWLSNEVHRRRILLEELVCISDRVSDAPLLDACGYGISFNRDLCQRGREIKAFCPDMDCNFLALLLFGRDMTVTRRGF